MIRYDVAKRREQPVRGFTNIGSYRDGKKLYFPIRKFMLGSQCYKQAS